MFKLLQILVVHGHIEEFAEMFIVEISALYRLGEEETSISNFATRPAISGERLSRSHRL